MKVTPVILAGITCYRTNCHFSLSYGKSISKPTSTYFSKRFSLHHDPKKGLSNSQNTCKSLLKTWAHGGGGHDKFDDHQHPSSTL
jgi:hypothetical protein